MEVVEPLKERWANPSVLEADYVQLYSSLYARAVSSLLDPELAQDAVSDVFLSCWQLYRERALTTGERRALLFKAVNNRCIDLIRRRRNKKLAYHQVLGRRWEHDSSPEELFLRQLDPASPIGQTLSTWLQRHTQPQHRGMRECLSSLINEETEMEEAIRVGRTRPAIKSLRFRLRAQLSKLRHGFEMSSESAYP